ncbi:melanocortin receptor 4-like [Stylophora pistillata]|uniref:melanocortin receptor 4-like n=1 Tax=Stylophora pistillata TaxID=50429 RepID=UPI000C0453A4|nr:melanocortin receptor 4-like [Stylophora pistillata]
MANTIMHNILLINCVFNILLALTSITGNTLVLHGIWKTTSLRSPSITLLCFLASSDLGVGAVVQPLFVANDFISLYSESQVLKDVFLDVFNVFGFCVCGISLCTVTAISVDRLIAIRKPLQYPNVVTNSRVTCTLGVIWTVCVVLASFEVWAKRFLLIALETVICVCLFISTISNLIIYGKVRHHQHAIQIQVQAVETNNKFITNSHVAGLKRSALNSFIVFLVLLVCYCPYFVVYMVSSFHKMNSSLAASLTSTVVFMNSAVNPFLYCWRLREIRSAVKKTYRKLVCCK